MLVQPAQSLTDLILGIVVVTLAVRMRRVRLSHRHWQASFWWSGIAALAGAVHHGFIVRWPRWGDVSWAIISAMVVVAISYLLAATVAEVLGPGRARAFWLLRSLGLIDDLEVVDWPKPIKDMQRNWVGRSEGAEVDFPIVLGDAPPALPESGAFPEVPAEGVIRVYTTRPDTLFGATYMVLAPEHPLVDRVATPEQREAVAAYREQAARKSDLDRTDLAKTKTGVFTGGFAVNPVNGSRIPIWIADYVLMGYGTGAIMAVPAHDQRDFEFAKKFGLPIVLVVQPEGQNISADNLTEAWPHDGVMVNSGSSALYLAAELLDLQPGGEFITPALTFSTTVAPFVKKGWVPAYVDVEEGTYNTDWRKVEAMITPKTKAMIIPNLIGNLPDWAKLREIADKYNLFVLEDSADTLGAQIGGASSGRFTDMSTTSFYGSHIINCAGKVVAPGLVDMRAFVGEPGASHRETFASASQAAALAGERL